MIQDKTLKVAKETDDVMVLFVNTVKTIKAAKAAGKSSIEIAQALGVGEIKDLIEAVNGADQIGAENKEDKAVVLATIGYRAGELAGALVG